MKVLTTGLACIALIMLILTGCAQQQVAKEGDQVKVHYTGTLDDGTQFDSSVGGDPMQFIIGSGQVIPGFDTGITGMAVGEKKTITIAPEDAYGQPRPDLVMNVPLASFPDEITPEVGLKLTMQRPDGMPMPITIVGMEGDSVTIDANHELAGKTLTFELELVEIVEPTS
jgi:peptidylprolyl isomerase